MYRSCPAHSDLWVHAHDIMVNLLIWFKSFLYLYMLDQHTKRTYHGFMKTKKMFTAYSLKGSLAGFHLMISTFIRS